LKLASKGYYGGDIDKVMQAPISSVLITLNYLGFQEIYEETYIELNKTEKK